MNDSMIERKRITRIACIIALLLVVVMAGAHGVFAADIVDSGTCGKNLTWTLDSDGLLTIEGSGSMYYYYSSPTPWGSASVKSVVISEGVTSIGVKAFYNCSSLMNVTIPGSVTSIENYAFEGCNGLTSITISEGVTRIGQSAFSHCSSLESIMLPASITSIEGNAFSGCDNLTIIFEGDAPSWANSVVSFFSQVLLIVPYGNDTWTYPQWNGVNVAYKGISPDDNSALDANRCNKNGLKFSLNEENFTATIAKYYGNESGIVKIPSRVTKDGARYTVIGIGNVFNNNKRLKGIEIGANIENLPEEAFSGCTNLESIKVAENNNSYCVEDGILYNKDKTTMIKVPVNKTHVSIPKTVTRLESYSFYGCDRLESLTLPNNITSIGSYALAGCSGIKNLVIPDSVTSIGDAVLSNCIALETLTVPFIGGQTIYGTNRDINPSYYTFLPLGYLFDGYTNPAPDGTVLIEQYYKGGYYRNSDYDWNDSDYNTFTPIDTTRSASYCIPTSLRSVTVTGGSLYYGAFYNCSMIEEITLGKDVEFTGERAFYGCSSLERINVNKNNKDLASDSNGVLYSKDYKTIKCYPSGKKVASYQIDSRVEAIDEFAFYNCLNLESLYVPETVTEIPTNSIAYYDLTMFVYRGSAAEAYAKSEDIAYKYIGEGKAKNVRVTSEYNLPVIASGEENGSVIGDYDGVAGVVSDSTVNYDGTKSGLQTVTVIYDGEAIETQAVVYDPVKEHFFDFGDVKEIQKSERGLAGMFDGNGRFLGLSEVIVLENHETVLIPNEVYEEAVEAKLMVIDANSFAPTSESVEEGL